MNRFRCAPLLAVLALAACGFSESSIAPLDDGGSFDGPRVESDAGRGDSVTVVGGCDAIADLAPAKRVEFVPSNNVSLADEGVASLCLEEAGRLTIETGATPTATWTNAQGVSETRVLNFSRATVAGQSIAVLQVGELYIGTNTVLRAVGSQALAISVARSALIDGTIDASSTIDEIGAGGYAGGVNGPGGYCADCCVIPDCSPANSGDYYLGGLGGSHGGRGGGVSAGANWMLGSEENVPLIGGAGGGSGGSRFPNPARGGHGGGALQISAGIFLHVDGTVIAGGGGGEGNKGYFDRGGGGAGAGGGLLLEAPVVSLGNGALVSVHGGSAGSSAEEGLEGRDGQSGSELPGGTPLNDPGDGRGPGGRGSDSTGDGGRGERGADELNRAEGGDGGGAGRIRINQLEMHAVPDGAVPAVVATTGLITLTQD